MKNNSSFWMFLIGLGSFTQFHFVGSLGLSELPIFLIAPFLFMKDYRQLKEDGFLPFVWLAILTCVGCIVSSYLNKTPFIYFLKGLAHPYAIFASTVVVHRVLRGNFNSIRSFFIGAFISGIISIFIFQQETYTVIGSYVAVGAEATMMVINNPLFWSYKIKEVLMLPVKAFYLSIPISYSVFAGILSFVVTFTFSGESGRSAALVMLMSIVLIFIGGKSRFSIQSFGKRILLFGVCGVVVLLMFKSIYSWTAKNGYLGYDAQQKYLKQTRTGESVLALLMAGRMELFCGVMACLDNPIWGFGPKGEDTKGYLENYLAKYAAQEDYDNFMSQTLSRIQRDGDVYIQIPSHSHIAMFWIYYGIIGLVLWLYVLWLIFMYFKKYAWAVPHWYGFMCLMAPSYVWHIFFSPFADRIVLPIFVSCILFSKLVVERKIVLPIEMEFEARKYD